LKNVQETLDAIQYLPLSDIQRFINFINYIVFLCIPTKDLRVPQILFSCLANSLEAIFTGIVAKRKQPTDPT